MQVQANVSNLQSYHTHIENVYGLFSIVHCPVRNEFKSSEPSLTVARVFVVMIMMIIVAKLRIHIQSGLF